MKVPIDTLCAKLERELGGQSVKSDPDHLRAYSVEGKSPTLLGLPNAPEETATALRLCAEAEAAVIPWGGGTSANLGNVPRQVHVVIGTEKLDRLIEHDDANLTATAQAGMKVAALQEILGERNQFLAIDPPYPSLATIGGSVAANTNGPRRLSYGSLRDLVIGMKIALLSGTVIKAGGKVVKNVAGYDMCKLFVGSLGTLGIITEITLKLTPIPESAASVVTRGSLEQSMQMVADLMRSALLPAAVTILNREAAKDVGLGSGMPAAAIWVEGFREAVSRHLRDLQAMARQNGLNSSEILHNEPHHRLWEKIRDFGKETDRALYRLTLPLASVAPVVAAVDRWSASEASTRIIAHAGTGTVWVSLNGDRSLSGWFPRLIALAQEHQGHAVMAAAPAQLKEGIDVWGPPPQSAAIMRKIKRQFDPQGLLNPGRFVAGL